MAVSPQTANRAFTPWRALPRPFKAGTAPLCYRAASARETGALRRGRLAQQRHRLLQPDTLRLHVRQNALDGQPRAEIVVAARRALIRRSLLRQARLPLLQQRNRLLARQMRQKHQADVARRREAVRTSQRLAQQLLEGALALCRNRIDFARRAVALLLRAHLDVAVAAEPLQDGVGGRLLHIGD